MAEKKISLPAIVQETSGLELINDSTLITHNDSGNDAVLYFLSLDGKIKSKLILKKSTNIDWEDISLDNQGNIWLADLGNNTNARENLKIHQIHLGDSSEKKISIKYADQKFPVQEKNHNYDSEALFFTNNHIYTLTKSNSTPYVGICKLYKINTLDSVQLISPIDSINLGNEGYWKNSVTAADISDDGKTLAILTYGYLFLFFDFEEDSFLKGKYIRFTLPEMQQREAVVFDKNNNVYITDENSRLSNGGFLYYYNLSNLFSGNFYFREPEIEKIKLKKKKEIPMAIRREFYELKFKVKTDEKIYIQIMENGIPGQVFEKLEGKKIKKKFCIENRNYNSLDTYSVRIYAGNKLIYSNTFL